MNRSTLAELRRIMETAEQSSPYGQEQQQRIEESYMRAFEETFARQQRGYIDPRRGMEPRERGTLSGDPSRSGFPNWATRTWDYGPHESPKEEAPNKIAYQPGMAIADFVAKEIEVEKDKDRLKWLHVFQNCVLPKEVRDTIEEALVTVLMAKKFDEWGINETFEKGLTNSILIYGPPGTGKTMVAESFAAVLGKNLLKITSAEIQSQVPGQAERNITANFKKAKDNNAVLMFDECDSLLYDRNAVGMIMASEINHLLTEIERFDGVVILTTNRLARLDPALQRRIIAKVELALPEEAERLQIWKNLVPHKVPLAVDVDFKRLAKLPISGGDIKNMILLAIRKAIAQNQSLVTMDHFRFAAHSACKAKQDYEAERPRMVPYMSVVDVEDQDMTEEVTLENTRTV